MSEPLDFSSIGSKKTAPPSQAPKKQRAPKKWAPKQHGPRKQRVPKAPRFGMGPSTKTVVLVVVVLAVVVASVGGHRLFDRGRVGATKSQIDLAGKNARYCELAKAFDSLAPSSAADVSASSVSRIFSEMGVTVREMEAIAPSKIRADVALTVQAYRAAAQGNFAGLQSASFQARRQRLIGYQQSACMSGTGTGEQ